MISEQCSASVVYKDETTSLSYLRGQEALSTDRDGTLASQNDINLSSDFTVNKTFHFQSTLIVEKKSATLHNECGTGDGDTDNCPIDLRAQISTHKATILNCLNPYASDLFSLLDELELDDGCDNRGKLKRKELAEIVLKEVEKKQAYDKFLHHIERDREDMGHQYIACLLRGEQYATEEKVEESSRLQRRIKEVCNNIVKMLNVNVLEPYLSSEGLVTKDEQERLELPNKTSQDKAKELLVLLKRKGPTAHSIFVHECLAEEDSEPAHRELYVSLCASRPRKRKSITDSFTGSPKTKVPKSHPLLLKPPEGIVIERYFRVIQQIRSYHLIGKEMWCKAEELYEQNMADSSNPIEMKTALLLESCTMYITDNQPQVVLERVEQARQKCFQIDFCNSQILEGRCEWVLAKLYRYMKDYAKAEEHIRNAFQYHRNCERGEDVALTSYCHACILLSDDRGSSRDIKGAISDLQIAIGVASDKKYGLDTSHCRLRLAQTNLGSSSHQPPGTRTVHSVADAQRALEEIIEVNLQPRTRCMYHYIWSDYYSVIGQGDQAIKSAELALSIAKQHNFKTEIMSSQIRLKPLISYN